MGLRAPEMGLLRRTHSVLAAPWRAKNRLGWVASDGGAAPRLAAGRYAGLVISFPDPHMWASALFHSGCLCLLATLSLSLSLPSPQKSIPARELRVAGDFGVQSL